MHGLSPQNFIKIKISDGEKNLYLNYITAAFDTKEDFLWCINYQGLNNTAFHRKI